MNIVFFGTPDFSVPVLEALAKKHTVQAVVTQPDRQRGRGMKQVFSPVKAAALNLNIEVLQPENINTDSEILQKLEDLNPDFFVVIAYGQILRKKVLHIPAIAPLNIHASLLPAYRGASPIHMALLNGDAATGVCSIKMVRKMDAGDILVKIPAEIYDEDTFASLHDRLAQLSAECAIKTIENYRSITPESQDEELATYCSKITRESAQYSFSMSAGQLKNHIRAFADFPGVKVFYADKQFMLHRVSVIMREHNAQPGEILWVNSSELIVACGFDAISILMIQRPGKKKMEYAEFARGFQFEKGNIFYSEMVI